MNHLGMELKVWIFVTNMVDVAAINIYAYVLCLLINMNLIWQIHIKLFYSQLKTYMYMYDVQPNGHVLNNYCLFVIQILYWEIQFSL